MEPTMMFAMNFPDREFDDVSRQIFRMLNNKKKENTWFVFKKYNVSSSCNYYVWRHYDRKSFPNW